MEISFDPVDLETTCRQAKRATRLLGALAAKKLHIRLAELFNAESVAELVSGRPHPLTGDRAGQFAVDLHGGTRLVFRPTKTPPPAKTDGSVDWSKVTSVTIVFIGNYHD